MSRYLTTAASVLVLLFCSCATSKTVTFTAEREAELRLVTFNDPTGSGEKLGMTPVVLQQSRVAGKIVKVTVPGTAPSYWIFPGSLLTSATVKLNPFENVCTKTEVDQGDINLPYRMLMEAYQELTNKNFPEAIRLARQLHTAYPGLAAPLIVMGLAHLGQGESGEARKMIAKARTLDPNDPKIIEINNLLDHLK